MTEIPKTIDEAWGAFNSRVFNHGKDETPYNSFRTALSCLFDQAPSPVDRGTVPCECTKVAQDDSCPIGYPSLLCDVCDGKGHLPAVKLDGRELWEIVFGIASDAAAAEITDEQYQQIADAINKVFIDPIAAAPSDDEVDDGRSKCFVCLEAFFDGDPVYYSDDGYMHETCCGPDRDSFYNDDGELKEGDPVPRPLIWTSDEMKVMPIADDAVNDDVSVYRFSKVMRAKMEAARNKGRSGWDDPARCSLETLSAMLLAHVDKGDPVDIANFAMMLHQRGAQIHNVYRFQARVAQAHVALFHDDPTDVPERLARFFEEANETCQALGMSREDAHAVVDYTYDRPTGEPAKEIGAAYLTLASLCVVAGYELSTCGEDDLRKLQEPATIERIRAKRSTRHGRGPLPGFDPISTHTLKDDTNA